MTRSTYLLLGLVFISFTAASFQGPTTIKFPHRRLDGGKLPKYPKMPKSPKECNANKSPKSPKRYASDTCQTPKLPKGWSDEMWATVNFFGPPPPTPSTKAKKGRAKTSKSVTTALFGTDSTACLAVGKSSWNDGKVRCCSGRYKRGHKRKYHFASCDTPNVRKNFGDSYGAPRFARRKCRNYAAEFNNYFRSRYNYTEVPTAPDNTYPMGFKGCPYDFRDRPFCDVSAYVALNGQNCREHGNNCLGKVSCSDAGAGLLPKPNPRSGGFHRRTNGLPAAGTRECKNSFFDAGVACFYRGGSENFYVISLDSLPNDDDRADVEPLCPEYSHWKITGNRTGECVCDSGFTGTIRGNNDMCGFTGRCRPKRCPKLFTHEGIAAAEGPRCVCKKNPTAIARWDDTQQKWIIPACSGVVDVEVSGYVKADVSEGEHYFENVKVELKVGKNPVVTVYTDAVGFYVFEDLAPPPGGYDYEVNFKTAFEEWKYPSGNCKFPSNKVKLVGNVVHNCTLIPAIACGNNEIITQNGCECKVGYRYVNDKCEAYTCNCPVQGDPCRSPLTGNDQCTQCPVGRQMNAGFQCGPECEIATQGSKCKECNQSATQNNVCLSCNDGYRLDEATGKCININECLEGLHNCTNINCVECCKDTNGSFVCECPQGEHMNENGICVGVSGICPAMEGVEIEMTSKYGAKIPIPRSGIIESNPNFADGASVRCSNSQTSGLVEADSLLVPGFYLVECTLIKAETVLVRCPYTFQVLPDVDSPVLDCGVSGNTISAEATSPNGARINWNPQHVLVSDNFDDSTDLSVECNYEGNEWFPIGQTLVACKATDSGGLTGSCTFMVDVADTTPPNLQCPNITVISQEASALVQYAVVVSDSASNDENVTVECDPPHGSVFSTGESNVICTATDQSGLEGSCSFSVDVQVAVDTECGRWSFHYRPGQDWTAYKCHVELKRCLAFDGSPEWGSATESYEDIVALESLSHPGWVLSSEGLVYTSEQTRLTWPWCCACSAPWFQ